MRCLWFTTNALLIAASLSAQAPADTARLRPLDTIVVTAARVPQRDPASAVTVLSGAALRQQGIFTLGDALREVPGAQVVQTSSPGSLTSLYLRGGERGFTRVLLDGVPLNEPGGDVDFAELGLHDVERIEVVRGPASVIYGSDAVSGVIQLFTHDGGGGERRAAVKGGSFQTCSATMSVQGANESRRGAFSAERFSTRGIHAFNSAHAREVVTASAAGTLAGNELRLLVRSGRQRTGIPSDGTGAVVDRNARASGERTVIALSLARSGARARGRVLLSAVRNATSFRDTPDDAADTLGFYGFRSLANVERAGVDASVQLPMARLGNLLLGSAFEQQSQRALDNSDSEFGQFAGELLARRASGSLYAQWLRERQAATAIASARVDRSSTFGSFVTYRAGINARVPGGRVRASVGTGFREPTFFESFATGIARGNRSLNPERTLSADAGLDLRAAGGGPVLALTAFDQRFRDLIEYTFNTPGPTDPNYYNVAGAASRGIEAALGVPLGANVHARASQTWLRTRVTSAGFDSSATGYYRVGESLLRRAGSISTLGLRAASGRGAATVTGRLVSRRDDLDYVTYERVRMPGHGTVDGSLRWALRPWLTGTMDGSNLLGSRYQAVRGFASPGRAVYAGAEVTW
jgi:vitamin B12 transporter